MPWPVHPNGLLGAQGDNDTYQIQRSLRFNSADSAYLNRTPASAGNRKTWTWSGWVKRGSLGGNNVFMGNTDSSGYNGLYFQFDTSNNITIGDYGVGSYVWVLTTSQVFRDTSAWYHIVATFDSTQATTSDRVSLYVNGVKTTAFTTASYPSLNLDGRINSTQLTSIGRLGSYNGFYFDGYITEINFIDGQALTPSSFGETDAITGQWKAKAYSGTYGTNGFYLKFADNSGTTATTLGKDSSGNGNNWTPNNFSVTAGTGNDSLVDSPTNYGTDSGVGGEVRGNYATYSILSPVVAGGGSALATLANGNLDASSASASFFDCFSTFNVPSSGKWYLEWTITAVGTNHYLGIGSRTSWSSASKLYQNSGSKVVNGTTSSYGLSYTTSDVIGMALDMDVGTMTMYKNNSSQGVLTSDLISAMPSGGWAIIAEIRGTASHSINFGQRPFAYTAPTGFKALCTTNLPTPTIQKPSKYMDVVTYTGNGSARSIAGYGFSPDLVWIKSRSGAFDHGINDSVRGAGKFLYTNLTNAEGNYPTDFASFDSGGFSLGTGTGDVTNKNLSTYVAWAWDAGETSSTNTAGSITSTVRANRQAGFSIVGWTGNGSGSSTTGHGLTKNPDFIIVKKRNKTENWYVAHKSSGYGFNYGYHAHLNTTGPVDGNNDPYYFDDFTGGNTLLYLSAGSSNNGGNENGINYVAYCFAEVEGFSKFGSYTGNGSSDGPFVWCGFRPRYLMIKRIDFADSWVIEDSSRDVGNVNTRFLLAESSNAESSSAGALRDFLSNGFKLRSTNQNVNTGTYIFAAFAESPFKYARAR